VPKHEHILGVSVV